MQSRVSRRGLFVLAAVLFLLVGGVAGGLIFVGSNSNSGHDGDSDRGAAELRPTGAPPSAEPSRRATGWPDSANTGVPPGTHLSSMDHGLTITGPGTTLDKLEVHGDVTIAASNVTISNSRILGQVIIPLTHSDVEGVMITDTELDGQRKGSPNEAQPGITAYGGLTCLRCNVHGFNVGVAINGQMPTLIQDSWVHDMWPESDGHKDAIITNGSSNVTIEHNRLSCEVNGCSAAIGLFGDFSPISNWIVNNNLLNGGSYCSYAGSSDAKRYPIASDITWTNNHYGHELFPKCGRYGETTGWVTGHGNKWSGNVWDRPGGARPVEIPEP